MPLTTFSPDNVKVSPTSFPKVKLGKGEKGRVVCVERQPAYEWVHELKRPMFSKVHGQPLMEFRERSNGEKFETYKLDFVGRPICHGDPDILEDRGIDPDHCYACKLAKETDYVSAPSRRYAIHVLQYATETGSTSIAEPFSVATRVWVLTERRFAEIVELMREEKTTDPRTIDILLSQKGPESFQQYDMQLGRACELLASKERLTRGMQTYEANHAPDLAPFCGRTVDHKFLREDVDSIVAAWRKVREFESGDTTEPGVPSSGISEVDSSLLDMVGGGQKRPAAQSADPGAGEAPGSSAPPATAAAPAAGVPLGWEEFDASTTSVTEEGARSAPTPSSVQPAAPATGAQAPVDFDKLMADLGG